MGKTGKGPGWGASLAAKGFAHPHLQPPTWAFKARSLSPTGSHLPEHHAPHAEGQHPGSPMCEVFLLGGEGVGLGLHTQPSSDDSLVDIYIDYKNPRSL